MTATNNTAKSYNGVYDPTLYYIILKHYLLELYSFKVVFIILVNYNLLSDTVKSQYLIFTISMYYYGII